MGLLNSVILQARPWSWDCSSCIMMPEKENKLKCNRSEILHINERNSLFQNIELVWGGFGIFLILACILKTRPQVICK